MVYKVIGLMSGSSLDGLDVVYTFLEENRGAWKFDIQEAECIPYTSELTSSLKNASHLSVADYLKLDTSYGRFIALQVNAFVERHSLQHKVDFIASHGHTVFHDPVAFTSRQVGCGATIAAVTGLPVISDLRSMDVA
ncbi:MAG: anhydro-N-acetylmuramic acid kinase, partial [Sphingobacteriales bacterium]